MTSVPQACIRLKDRIVQKREFFWIGRYGFFRLFLEAQKKMFNPIQG